MQSPARRTFPPAPRHARALILRAHPHPGSFNTALAQAYAEGLTQAGIETTPVDTDALDFDLRLRFDADALQPLEPAITRLQAQVAEAAHLVVAAPVWWGSVPASLKGLIDRTFLPGWAFRSSDAAFPERGLRGRSSRVLLTMDAPTWWDRFKYGRSAGRQLENAWLQFCGLRSLGVTRFGGIEKTSPRTREAMLRRAHCLGARDGKRVAARGLQMSAAPLPVSVTAG